jgi:hypothetical protein
MLRPEVAALFALTSRSTYVHVWQLGRDYDLTKISVAQAEELLAVPGFDRLRRRRLRRPAVEVPPNEVGRVAATTGPTRAKKKKAST